MIDRLRLKGGSRVRAIGGRLAWTRVIVLAEVVALLLLAILLTVAPQITLGAIAGLAARVYEFSLGYRPVVAFFGLLLVAGSVAALWACLRTRRDDTATQGEIEEDTGPRRTRPAA